MSMIVTKVQKRIMTGLKVRAETVARLVFTNVTSCGLAHVY